jgi:hypothetical protein
LLVLFYNDARETVGEESIGPWTGGFDWREIKVNVDVPRRARLAVVSLGLMGATGELSFDRVAVAAEERDGSSGDG